ncbi:ParA family protein [Enterococcus sp. AN402]|uniref:ParA family protein n=1 Tax=Enterococcus sp. AN402 TaxID=3151386 RepID=UPI0034588A44
MSFIILMLNQKGGVGKTTLADEIAFTLERRGFSVAFVSTDPQGGQIHELCMDMSVIENSDFQVIDTAGQLKEDMKVWCREANVILVPILPSPRDLEPTLRTLELIRSSNTTAKVFVVINNFYSLGVLDRELSAFFDSENIDVLGKVPRAVALSQASAANKSVIEFAPYSHVIPIIEKIGDDLIQMKEKLYV